MSRIFVAGIGAVSPAGWNVSALRDALEKNEPLPVQSLPRPGWDEPLRTRLVPNPPVRPEFLAHPRLRRTSPITHYAAFAALEALAGLRANPAAKNSRLGIVVCLQSGCVQYSCRFYDETLKNRPRPVRWFSLKRFMPRRPATSPRCSKMLCSLIRWSAIHPHFCREFH